MREWPYLFFREAIKEGGRWGRGRNNMEI